MKRITSRDNPVFRTLRRWSTDAAARRAAGVALLEGIHLADAFVASGGIPERVVVGRSALDVREVAATIERITTASPSVDLVVVDDPLFDALRQLAQGVALIVVVRPPAPAASEHPIGTSVLLDRVQDPGNVGSILRSAAAAGIVDVVLSRECAGAWSPKVLRAAMGAHFGMRIVEDADLTALRGRTATWIATAPRAPATIYETDLRADVTWLFGHEGQGIDPVLMREATVVRIPQPGHGESLNVAASAAICFFEQVRQRSVG